MSTRESYIEMRNRGNYDAVWFYRYFLDNGGKETGIEYFISVFIVISCLLFSYFSSFSNYGLDASSCLIVAMSVQQALKSLSSMNVIYSLRRVHDGKYSKRYLFKVPKNFEKISY